MKNKFLALVVSFLIVGTTFAQTLDRSTRPEPAPARKIELGEYKSFTLDNGLKVYVVTNDKQPRISVQLTLDTDPILEGEKAGYLGITGQLMRRGTKNRTKEEIDNEIDFIGASLSASAGGVFGSSLVKHKEKLFDLFADVALNPIFPEEELEKVKKQTMDGIESSKESPDAIMSTLSGVMVYGADHPYGEYATVETVERVTREDCQNFYDTYFRPNVGYMAIVGDIEFKKAKKLVEKYFSKWEKADVPEHKYDMPNAPEMPQVDLMDKSGAVQSIIKVAYPVDFKRTSEDYIPARLTNEILGGGSSGRLFQNLREDKGYTYGAYSSLSSDDLVGQFSAGASVRTEVTDSAVAQFMYELERINKEPVAEEDLQLVKNVFSGDFARSLESPQTLARFAISTAIYDLPKDYYETYLQKVEATTVEDIQKAAKKYINSDKAHIVVVGNADSYKDNMTQFGKVTQYDMYGNVVEEVDEEALTKDLNAEKVLAKYIEAIGGEEKVAAIKAVRKSASTSIQGMTLNLEMVQAKPNKMYVKTILPMGMGEQVQIFNGKAGKVITPQGSQMLEGEQLEKEAFSSMLYMELYYDKQGISVELDGAKKIDGKNAFKVIFKSPKGQQMTNYYDAESFLLVKSENATGANTLSDYKEVDGVMVAHVNKVQSPQASGGSMTLTTSKVEINPEDVKDDLFKVE